ncbi:ER membrane protein complex subunit 10, partial [Asparagus officinalis]|uniref:ER membrane protein complex subunit 10 n=1 Tax=Asparagus officinalis TaxID=4686 RepID=UPI00098E05AE
PIRYNEQSSPLSLLLFTYLLSSPSAAFESDELIQNDDEFEGVQRSHPDLDSLNPNPNPNPSLSPPIRRKPDLESSSSSFSSESKSIQFSLEHSLAGDGDGFSPAGTFTARLKSWSHGGQTLTKLRFSRNALTGAEKEAFERLLKEDGFYTIRVPANVLNPPGKEYVVSSVRARCLPRDSLDEQFVIHTDGVNILAVNYGSAGACQYPRILKLPTKWSFNSYTVLKNSEQARRTPMFTEELLQAETGEGEGVKPPEKSFWAKYWMYLIPLGMIVMNAVTQAMNIPDEQADAQSNGQPQGAAQRAPSAAAVRRR